MKRKLVTLLTLFTAMSAMGTLSSCSEEEYDAVIAFWHTFGGGIQGVMEEHAQAFQDLVLEHDNLKIKIQFTNKGNYDDIKKNISSGFSASSVPTISVAYPDHVANYLAAEETDGEYVVNLQELYEDPEVGFGKEEWLGEIEDYDANDIVGEFLEEGKHYAKPGTFTLPFLKSSEVLFFNKTAVTRAMGLKEGGAITESAEDYLKKMSWDEFIEFNRFIVENKKQISNKLETPIFYDSDSNLFITKMAQNNINYSSIDSKGEGVVDFEFGEARTKTFEMVKKLKGVVDEGLLTTKDVEGKYGSKFFTTGKSIFSIGSTGGTGYVTPQGNAFKLGCVRVPADNNNPKYVSQGPCLTILRNTGDTDEVSDLKVKYAWKFVKYLLTPEINTLICTRGSEGYIPVRDSAYSTEEFTLFLRDGEEKAAPCKIMLSEINGKYINTAVFPGSSELRDACGSIITQVFQSNKKGDALDTDINRIIGEQIAVAKRFM